MIGDRQIDVVGAELATDHANAQGGGSATASPAIVEAAVDVGRRAAVARIGDGLYAFDDLSPTDRSPLYSGRLTGTVIMSPCDRACFDVSTGQAAGRPDRFAAAYLRGARMDGLHPGKKSKHAGECR